ncbi:MAG: OmpA/MotB domain-containing protein [Bacteroidetes bacterium]|nr:MAG: OmpA/MotB domain-containing protein [Bacteroidota bacterium]
MPARRFLLLLFFLDLGFAGFARADQTGFTLSDSVFQQGSLLRTYAVVFDYDKNTIRPPAFPFLDSVAQFLLKHDSLSFEIRSHLDVRSSSEMYGQNLSQKRAKAIADYFIAKGIAAKRLIPKGYHNTMPLFSKQEIAKMKTKEEQEAAYAKNRRVEFVIISTKKPGE